jgi:hypothetical protein
MKPFFLITLTLVQHVLPEKDRILGDSIITHFGPLTIECLVELFRDGIEAGRRLATFLKGAVVRDAALSVQKA